MGMRDWDEHKKAPDRRKTLIMWISPSRSSKFGDLASKFRILKRYSSQVKMCVWRSDGKKRGTQRCDLRCLWPRSCVHETHESQDGSFGPPAACLQLPAKGHRNGEHQGQALALGCSGHIRCGGDESLSFPRVARNRREWILEPRRPNEPCTDGDPLFSPTVRR
jgi:hypothetical protein